MKALLERFRKSLRNLRIFNHYSPPKQPLRTRQQLASTYYSLFYSSPFVLGSNSRIRSSREQAPRIALANALKIASIL